MKNLAIATAIIATLSAGIASAELNILKDNGVTLSGSTTITSNYIWRGKTQNSEDSAVQSGIELSAGGLYGGAWMSNVAGTGDVETNKYVGFTTDLGAISTDVGYIKYDYKDNTLDFEEYYAGATTNLSGLNVGGKYYSGKDNATNAYDLTASTTVGDLDVGYTYNKYTDVGKSHTINAEIPLNSTFSLGATYSDFNGEVTTNDQTNTAWYISSAF
jgi:uncharacterized protein (TIGR02001 family)